MLLIFHNEHRCRAEFKTRKNGPYSSFLSTSQAGADQYACFHSIVETAKRNGKSKFGTLYQLIIEDNPDRNFIEAITS